jgi:hypothetical protein
VSYQDAVGTLARERELAESGALLLKAHVGAQDAAMARGEQLYGNAKAASDELIARLLVAVREGDDPGRSDTLRSAMTEAVEQRLVFTRHVEGQLPKEEGARAIEWLALLNPAKTVAETIKALAETASVLWKTWREGRELDRQAVTTQIETQRWRAFDKLARAG